jgi:hypothetical protein
MRSPLGGFRVFKSFSLSGLPKPLFFACNFLFFSGILSAFLGDGRIFDENFFEM